LRIARAPCGRDFSSCRRTGRVCLPTQAIGPRSNGLGKEDLLFGEDKEGRSNEPASIGDNVARLKLLTADHKAVFAVEYLDVPQEIVQARQQLMDYGFIPYFADRALDRMRMGDLPDSGPQPGRK